MFKRYVPDMDYALRAIISRNMTSQLKCCNSVHHYRVIKFDGSVPVSIEVLSQTFGFKLAFKVRTWVLCHTYEAGS